MQIIKRLWRIIKINYVLLKYNLDSVLYKHILLKPLTIAGYFIRLFYPRIAKLTLGHRMRLACEELGPIFIKCGQLLSTRGDLLPDEVATELAKLQDQVPGFCGIQAQKIIATSLQGNITALFKDFDDIPLASASIAQVHAATMQNGEAVVVKVLRPKIKQMVKQDIELILLFAALAERYWVYAYNFKPLAVAKEIQKTLYEELDLLREAANAAQLRRNFTDSDLLYVPQVYWSHTSHDVLTLERIYGVPISQVSTADHAIETRKSLASKGVEIFFTQVFRDCFFHADMHPGNVWVDITDAAAPKYLALDFGIMGTLTPRDQHYLAENFLAFFKRDYRKIAELHIESGWVQYGTRIDEFESAIRCICEPILQRPFKEISFGNALLKLLQTAHKFDMQIQPQLILLQKTLVSIEGLGRRLYPDLDLWCTAKPCLERWMRNRVDSYQLLRKIRQHAPHWLEKLPDLPGLVYHALQANQGRPAESASKLYATRPGIWYYFVVGLMSGVILMLLTRT